MGVSNVYDTAKTNAINALKANMSSQAKAKTVVNPDMTKNGSIWNMVGSDGKPKTASSSLVNTNLNRSLADLTPATTSNTKTTSSSSTSSGDFSDIDNAADGKAAAKQVSAQGDKVESYTKQAQSLTSKVQSFSSDSSKLDKEITQNLKTFQNNQRVQEAQLKRDNEQLDKIVKDTLQKQQEVDNAQNELDSLLAKNSFSVGGNNQGNSSSGDASKINELQTYIGTRVSSMQSNGKVIYTLQRSQTRTLRSMSKTNNQFVRVHTKNTKALKSQNTETNKTLETATKIEMYSMLAQMGGQALALAGRGLMALGGVMSGMGFGAALIATGRIMEQVGTVVELAGQYGVSAANITKTAAYMAEGNIMGAMQSCASAMQSGATAAKSTMELKNTFGQINAQANDTSNKLTARIQAKNDVKNMTPDELGGMSKKQMQKALTQEYKNQLDNSEDTFGRRNKFAEANDKIAALKKGEFTNDKGETIKTADLQKNVKSSFNTNLESVLKANGLTIVKDKDGNITYKDKDGKTVTDPKTYFGDKDYNKITKRAGNKTINSFKNIASNTKKTSTPWYETMGQASQSIMSAASMYMMFSQGGMSSNMMGMGGYSSYNMGSNNNAYNTRRYARA